MGLFFLFVLSLISTVCELFLPEEVPCFTLQDIFISGEVLVLAFWSDLISSEGVACSAL